ncbi:helix-turn-helix domain-containing protein [Deinococcus ruber]|uniref:HTH cro/C1-type domain-containing protein n=1 Tax=Deinococcus ruber TaxID=1848197 RepID=A0A918FIM7_9DEIO|nr:hypothetical protein [Deinococcus ruber]GGR39807.1 hypothetical protein GCM10008957_55690 [Deinococcus ruber]
MDTYPPQAAAEAVDKMLSKAGKTRSELARELGLSRQQITRTINSTALLNERAAHWLAILDALGLEVVIQPKKPAE